jgi:hypothetical protein
MQTGRPNAVPRVVPVGHVGRTFVTVTFSHIELFEVDSWYPAGQDILAYSLRR